MSKRHAFEPALKTEIRWPTKGDTPFTEAAEPLDNAVVVEDGFTRLVLMTEGYKQAGDLGIVTEQLSTSNLQLDIHSSTLSVVEEDSG